METLPEQYARALYEATDKKHLPPAELFKNFRAALIRRHHETLMPRIAHSYEKLRMRERRLKHYRTNTPARERTRILLELYRVLISRQ